jgi:hypothetical protein
MTRAPNETEQKREVAEGLRRRRAELGKDAPSFDAMARMTFLESDGLVQVTSQTINQYHKGGGTKLEWVVWIAKMYDCTLADISPTCARRLDMIKAGGPLRAD